MIVNSPVYNTLVAEETCLVNSMRQFVFKEERGRPVSLDHAELRTAGSFYSLNQVFYHHMVIKMVIFLYVSW
mgnify:CR=1 FL=1